MARNSALRAWNSLLGLKFFFHVGAWNKPMYALVQLQDFQVNWNSLEGSELGFQSLVPALHSFKDILGGLEGSEQPHKARLLYQRSLGSSDTSDSKHCEPDGRNKIQWTKESGDLSYDRKVVGTLHPERSSNKLQTGR